jgi:glycosyltransferase involved in cell wall biosynthesis
MHKFFFAMSRYLPRRVSEATFGLFIQLITQVCQRSIVRRLVCENGIDVVHQPIPVSPRFPSAMFDVGAPVVIGPMNGGMEYPAAWRSTESVLSRAAIAFARVFTGVGNFLLPGKRRASILLVANERTRRALPSGLQGKVVELAENGVDFDFWRAADDNSVASATRFMFLGRLVDWKAVDVVIRALKLAPRAEVEIVGDGPMKQELMALANELGVRDRVRFAGWLPQQQCSAHLRDSAALVLPSIYECGGAVVLEAMACGKPVIATAWGGPVDYLDSSCGILVKPESQQALVSEFAAAMQTLIDNPAMAKSMGASGRERAEKNFNWQTKIDQVIQIYGSIAEKMDVSCTPIESRVSSRAVSGPRGS